MQSQQAATRLLGLLAMLSSVLSAIGLYGVVAYTMAQRTKEIGVRVALGAQARDVLRVVASEARGMLAGGLIVGFGAALVMSRLVSSMLYGVGGAGMAVFVAAGTIMIVTAIIAISVPAWRALRVAPLVALRAD